MAELLVLFIDFLKIGGLSIGGGYAIIPLINEQVVSVRSWLTIAEFTDIITISQMTPGPIAVNTSTFVGMRVAGIPGAIIATLGCIFIGVLITYTLYKVFNKYAKSLYIIEVLKGLKSSSLGLIVSAAVLIILMAFFEGSKVGLATINYAAIAMFTFSLVLVRKYKMHPIAVMLVMGGVGAVVYGF